jgi:glucokinase
MSNRFLGIEIGGTKLQIVAGNDAGGIEERFRFAIQPAGGAAGILLQIEETVRQLAPRVKPAAIGVGFGGPVDWQTGVICCSHHIAGWTDFPLGGWLRRLAGAPVYVDNDANVAALGEARRGAGVGHNPVFYVTLGSGVGGGLVLDGRIFHGAKPGEAEIGHVRLDRSGIILESRCSGWAVDAKVRGAIAQNPSGLMARQAGGGTGGEARWIAPALAGGDVDARRILDETAADLGFGLSHVAQLFHPAVIVLGGGLSLIGEPLRAAVEESLHPFVMRAFRPGPKILLAGLGEEAVPAGALELAKQSAVAKQS